MEESTSIPPGRSLSLEMDKIQKVEEEREREMLDYQNLNNACKCGIPFPCLLRMRVISPIKGR